MDEKNVFQKTLHLLIEEFILEFEQFIELQAVNRNKVFLEIAKRSAAIGYGIRTAATNLLASFQSTGVPIPEEAIKKKASYLVAISLQQDLLACALTADEVFGNVLLTNDNLHTFLYSSCMNYAATISSSLMHNPQAVCFEESAISCDSPSLFPPSSNFVKLNCFDGLNKFEDSNTEFEKELLKLKSILETEIGSPDEKDLAATAEKFVGINESIKITVDSESQKSDTDSEDLFLINFLPVNQLEQVDDRSLGLHDAHSSLLSWESRMRQSVPCHLYTSEVAGKEVLSNLTEEDPHMFRSLYDSSGVLSEYDFLHDTLDLLVGIPSNTFAYDENRAKFEMKPHVHLSGISHESTLRFAEKFIAAGNSFRSLKTFCSASFSTCGGLVSKALKDGIHEILSVFMEYIASINMNSPTMHMLRNDITENAELLCSLGTICGISYYECNMTTLPKGLGLISYLNRAAWSCKTKGNAILVAVILKFAYYPYFSFLNRWMSDGVCLDPFDEFQIIENPIYLDRRDEHYWKFAYTECKDNSTRVVPLEVQRFSQDILQCGKSMRLLQSCCPKLFSLEYMYCNPSPCVSMVFSYHAADEKRGQCENYILQKDTFERNHLNPQSVASDDDFHVRKQMFVDRKVMLKQIQRKWNRMKLFANSAIKGLSNETKVKEASQKRSRSISDIHAQVEDASSFNGIIYKSIGLLFSSCGYIASNDKSKESRVNTEDQKISTSRSREAIGLLRLKPSSHAIPLNQENYGNNRYKNYDSCPPISNPSSKTSCSANKTVPKEDSENQQSNVLPRGSFLDLLASLLVSEYGDSKEDICSFIQMTSLQNLMQYNFSAVLNMRMHLIQKTIMDYVMNHLRFKELLLCLRNTYFFQDESFSQSLCRRIFNWTVKCSTLEDFTNWSFLNEMLMRSIDIPSLSDYQFLKSASVNTVAIDEPFISKRNKFMQFFQFTFKIDWPLNIIVHEEHVAQYMQIFSCVLEIEFLCWLLGRIWRLLIIDGKDKHLENSPDYRKVMLNRFDMHQFVRVLRNCIHQDLGGPLWESLEKNLEAEEMSIDKLEAVHLQYLEKALTRCFLTENTMQLHKVLEFLFEQVYQFCSSAESCSWQLNPHTNYYESSESEMLSNTYSRYKMLKESFYSRISNMTRRSIFKTQNFDEHFLPYLDTILETGRNL